MLVKPGKLLTKRFGITPQATTVVGAMTTEPSPQRIKAINQLTRDLAPIWSTFDTFYVLAAHTSQAALLNWKNPGTFNMTEVNSPTFTVDRGYTGDGATSYLNSGFNPTTAPSPNLVLDSQNVWAWISTLNNGVTSGFVGNTRSRIFKSAGGAYTVRLGTGASVGAASGNQIGLFSATRPDNANVLRYYNGANIDTLASASVSNQSESMYLLRTDGAGYSAQQCAAGGWGSTLTAGQQTILYNGVLAYLQAVGAA